MYYDYSRYTEGTPAELLYGVDEFAAEPALAAELTVVEPPWHKCHSECLAGPQPNVKAFIRSLGMECLDFHDYIQPTVSEQVERQLLFDKVQCIINECSPEAQIRLHGSYCNKLSIPGSDVDFSVDNFPLENDYAILNVMDQLYQYGMDQVELLPCKKVHVIRFFDTETEMQGDIVFGSSTTECSVSILRKYLDDYPVARPVIALVKCLLKQSGFTARAGGLCSYFVAELVVAFIKMREAEKKLNGSTIDRSLLPSNVGGYFLEFLRHFSSDTASSYIYSPEYDEGIATKPATPYTDDTLVVHECDELGGHSRVSHRFPEMRCLFQHCLCILKELCDTQYHGSLLANLINCADPCIQHHHEKRKHTSSMLDCLDIDGLFIGESDSVPSESSSENELTIPDPSTPPMSALCTPTEDQDYPEFCD